MACFPHQAALHGGLIEDAKLFGWQTGFRQPSPALEGEGERTGRRGAHDWEIVVTGVQNYIKGLSFKYRTDLRSRGVGVRWARRHLSCELLCSKEVLLP